MKQNNFFILLLIVGFATIMTAQVPSYVPTNGLVGYWPFNGNANDVSTNANNGTVNGATLTTDRFGNLNSAYSFDGVNNLISVPNSSSLNLTSSATFSLWVKVNQLNFDSGSNDYSARLIDKSIVNTTNGYLIDYNHRITSSNTNYPNQCTNGSSRVRNITGNSIMLTDCYSNYLNWSYIVVAFNLGEVKTYINGMLNSTFTSNTTSISTTTLPLIFGHQTSGNSNVLNGKLDDIGIWNRALTADEISNLYNANICYQSVTVTDTLVINVGILGYNPVTYNNSITIYPNPAKDHITIDCGTLSTVTGYQIKISNLLGQEVFSTTLNQQQYSIPLNSWTGKGIYLVKVYDANSNLLTTRKIDFQ